MSHLTFKEFLTEIMVSDDPAQAMQDIKQAARMGEDRFRKQQLAKKSQEQKNIQQSDEPLETEKLRVSKKEQDLMRDKQRLAQKEKRMAKQQGVATGSGAM
jgi:hypothetical protein